MQQYQLPPAYGFVNGLSLEQEPGSEAVLQAWRTAGYPLGNHTWSHMNLNQNSVAGFMADTHKNEELLQKYMPVANYRWLRFPYLAEGDSAAKRADVRAQLARSGYRVASVTLSFGDYAWNEPYARCLAQGNDSAVQHMESSYLQAAAASLARARAMSKTLSTHEIPYVLLMHVGAFDARMLPRLIKLYRGIGVRFISLEQAEANPFYSKDVDLSLPSSAPTTLEEALAVRHLPIPPTDPTPPLDKLCK